MTDLEIRLLAALREYRRLSNQTVTDRRVSDLCHMTADELLAMQPELDNPAERFFAPRRISHREFVDSLTNSGYRGRP